MQRTVFGALLGVLLTLFIGLGPVNAQEDPPPDEGDTVEEPTPEPTPTPRPDDPDEDNATGSSDDELSVGGQDALDEGEGFSGDADPNGAVQPGAGDEAEAGGEEGGEGDDPDAAAAAAEPEEPPLDLEGQAVQIIEIDSSRYPAVDLVVAVPPALAGELGSDAFAMREGGIEVSPLTVGKLQDTIEVVVAIDTSGSMSGDPLAAAKESAKDFVASLDEKTRIAVIGFGETPNTAANFSSSRAEISAAIDGLVADGKTALYDALVSSVAELGESDSRRFVVVLSDGKDTASAATADDAANALIDGDVNLYAITLASPEADFRDLNQLASDVDGQVVGASDTAALAKVYADLASRLTNQYQLSFFSQIDGPVPISISVFRDGVLGIVQDTVEFTPLEAFSSSGGTGIEAAIPESPGEVSVAVAPTPGGFFQSSNALYIGLGASFLALVAFLFQLFSIERSSKPSSALSKLDFKNVSAKRGGLANISDRASSLAEGVLDRGSKRSELDALLERAGIEMRPGEFITTAVGVGMGFAMMGLLFFGGLGLPLGFGFGLFMSKAVIKRKANKRQRAFAEQLGDTLMMIAGSLRAGHGIVEAIDSVANQAESPTGDEFSRVVSEARIGRDLVDSLYDVAHRTDSEDFIWVVRAIAVNRELGGDLAEILDNVGDTIRDRSRLRDQVRALSAEGKVSAMVLIALPILVTAWVRLSNPEYLSAMTSVTAGKIAAGFAVFLLCAGAMWLKKLINVEF